MDNAAHIISGYFAVVAIIGVLGARVLLRARSLTGQLPAGERRWMDVDDDDA